MFSARPACCCTVQGTRPGLDAGLLRWSVLRLSNSLGVCSPQVLWDCLFLARCVHGTACGRARAGTRARAGARSNFVRTSRKVRIDVDPKTMES